MTEATMGPQLNAHLATLIGSRICHDLISPIGAINNGLELLTMSGSSGGPEMGLIGESVGNASARIRFFRIAFGAAGDQMVGPAEVSSILRDLYAAGRLNINWTADGPTHRSDVRMIFLGLMCVETAMPYGGNVSITHDDGEWVLHGAADRISLDGSLWEMLRDPPEPEMLQPSQVQFALLPLVCAEAGRQVRLEVQDTALTMRI